MGIHNFIHLHFNSYECINIFDVNHPISRAAKLYGFFRNISDNNYYAISKDFYDSKLYITYAIPPYDIIFVEIEESITDTVFFRNAFKGEVIDKDYIKKYFEKINEKIIDQSNPVNDYSKLQIKQISVYNYDTKKFSEPIDIEVFSNNTGSSLIVDLNEIFNKDTDIKLDSDKDY